jgi:hypothetical protein
LFTAVTALFFLLCGCQTIKHFIPNDEVSRFGTDRKYPDLNYTGDGNFTDYGRKAGILRFVLDLGAVNLTEASVSKFELKGLPESRICLLSASRSSSADHRKTKGFRGRRLCWLKCSLKMRRARKYFRKKLR